MIESVNKLLDWANLLFPGEGNETRAKIQAFASNIEHDFAIAADDESEKIWAQVARKYVKLPVDADGVPIHVGDVMEFEDGTEFTVCGLSYETLYYPVDDGRGGHVEWTQAEGKRHVHEPTTEDAELLRLAGDES